MRQTRKLLSQRDQIAFIIWMDEAAPAPIPEPTLICNGIFQLIVTGRQETTEVLSS